MRTLKWQRVLFTCFCLLLLAGCGREAWKQDADVRVAEADCAGLVEPQGYACFEAHAVTSLNPDGSRRLGSTRSSVSCILNSST